MTVRDLINFLEQEDPNALVVISNSDGDFFSPIETVEDGLYRDGEFFEEEEYIDSQPDFDDDDDEEEMEDFPHPAVALS